MKEINLKALIIFIMVTCLVVAIAGVGGFEWDSSAIDEFLLMDLELKNWHYFVLLAVIYSNG